MLSTPDGAAFDAVAAEEDPATEDQELLAGLDINPNPTSVWIRGPRLPGYILKSIDQARWGGEEIQS